MVRLDVSLFGGQRYEKNMRNGKVSQKILRRRVTPQLGKFYSLVKKKLLLS